MKLQTTISNVVVQLHMGEIHPQSNTYAVILNADVIMERITQLPIYKYDKKQVQQFEY